MNGLSAHEVMLVNAVWHVALSATTLGILWNARTRPVYLWCVSGVVSCAYSILAWGPTAATTYATPWGQPLLGFSLIVSISLKAASIKLLGSNHNLSAHVVTGIAMIGTVIALSLLGVQSAWISVLITSYVAALMVTIVRDIFCLGRTLKNGNTKLFAVMITSQGLLIFTLSILVAMEGKDPLAPMSGQASIESTIFSLVLSLVTTGIFISLMLDLHIRQRDDMRRELDAARIEQTRLQERQQLLADMHDGLGSQLATAKLKAERGDLNQSQVADLLRECMADLHLLVDSLRDEGDGLAAALADYRYRTERRLAGLGLQLTWRIELRDAPPLPQHLTVQVLRIVQEAINNTLKHAQARSIVITARHDRDHGFSIRVEDDGCGIAADPTTGQGLSNMRRRARELGATLAIKSITGGRGTRVELGFRVPSSPSAEQS